jgi:hypothetical protein
MILSVLLGGKSYTARKYAIVFTIVIGFIIFMYDDREDNKNHDHELLGKFLVSLSLLCDGLSGAVQVFIKDLTSFVIEQI